MGQRWLALILVFAALAAAQTIVSLGESANVAVTLRPCSWAYFSVLLPGTSTSFVQTTATVTNLVHTFGSGHVAAYQVVSATSTAASLPTFLSTRIACDSGCSVPATTTCVSSQMYLLIGVYSASTDEITFNVTTSTFVYSTLNVAQTITNNVPLTVTLNPMETYPFSFTIPAGVTNGFLRLSFTGFNFTDSLYVTTTPTQPYQCTLLGFIDDADVTVEYDANSYSLVSPCNWLTTATRAANAYVFGLVMTGVVPKQITINATVQFAHALTGAGSFTMQNAYDIDYHQLQGVANTVDEVLIYTTNPLNFNPSTASSTRTIAVASSNIYPLGWEYPAPAVGFSSLYGNCGYIDFATSCGSDLLCTTMLDKDDVELGSNYFVTLGGPPPYSVANTGDYQSVQAQYTLAMIATTYSAIPLTPNTPTPAVMPFGQSYQYFSVNITDADIASMSQLLVYAYLDATFNGEDASINILISGYGYPTDGSNGEGGSMRKTMDPTTSPFKYIQIDYCFLTVGTWYIAVQVTGAALARDQEFTITAYIDAPMALQNNTLTRSWVPVDYAIHRQFKFTAVETAAPSYLRVTAIPFAADNVLILSIQRGTPAGENGQTSACLSHLVLRKPNDGFDSTASFYAYFSNPTDGSNVLSLNLNCPFSPGDYYIGVVYSDNSNLPTADFAISVAQLPLNAYAANELPLGVGAPMRGSLPQSSLYSFNATTVPVGSALRFRLTAVTTHGDALLTNLLLRVYNDTDRCRSLADQYDGGLDPLEMYCFTNSDNTDVYIGSYATTTNTYASSERDYYSMTHTCQVVIPPSRVNNTIYHLSVSPVLTTDSGVSFEADDQSDFTIEAFVDATVPVALTDNVETTGTVDVIATQNGQLDHYYYTIPTDLALTDIVEVSLYIFGGASEANFQNLVLYFARDGLAGPEGLYSSWPTADHLAATPIVSLNGATTVQFTACDLPASAGAYLYIAVGTPGFYKLFQYAIPYTIRVRRVAPTALAIGATTVGVLPAGMLEVNTVYNHYAVTLPATLALNAQLVVRTVNADADTSSLFTYLTSSAAAPGLAGPMGSAQGFCHSTFPAYAAGLSTGNGASFSAITVSGSALTPSSTVYIALTSANPVGYTLMVTLDAPAITAFTPTTSLSFVPGQVSYQGHTDYAITTTRSASEHFRFTLRASSDVTGVVLFVNPGAPATATMNAVQCTTAPYGVSGYTCVVEVDNCELAGTLYASVQANWNGGHETVINYDLSVESVTPTPLVANTIVYAMLDRTLLNDNGYQPYMRFSYTVPAFGAASLNVTSLNGATLKIYLNSQGPAGAPDGGRCVQSERTSSQFSTLTVISLPTASYCGVGAAMVDIAISADLNGEYNASIMVVVQNVASSTPLSMNQPTAVTTPANQYIAFTSPLTGSITYGSVVEWGLINPSALNLRYYTWRNGTSCLYSNVISELEFYESTWGQVNEDSWTQFALGGADAAFNAAGGMSGNVYASLMSDTTSTTVTTSFNTIAPALLQLNQPTVLLLREGQVRTFYLPAQPLADDTYLVFNYGSAPAVPVAISSEYMPARSQGSLFSAANVTYTNDLNVISSSFKFPLCSQPTNVYGNYYGVVLNNNGENSVVIVKPVTVTASALTAGLDGSFTSYDLATGYYILRYLLPADSVPAVRFELPTGGAFNYEVSVGAGTCALGTPSGSVSINTTVELADFAICLPIGQAYTFSVHLFASAPVTVLVGINFGAPIIIAPNTPTIGTINFPWRAVSYKIMATADVNNFFVATWTKPGSSPQKTLSIQPGASPMRATITACGVSFPSTTGASTSDSVSLVITGIQSTSYYVTRVDIGAPQDGYTFSINMATTVTIPNLSTGSSYTPSTPLANLQYNIIHLVNPFSPTPPGAQIAVTLSGVTCGKVTLKLYYTQRPVVGATTNLLDSVSLQAGVDSPTMSVSSPMPATDLVTGIEYYVQVQATDAYVNQSTLYTVSLTFSIDTPAVPLVVNVPVYVTSDTLFELDTSHLEDYNRVYVTTTSGMSFTYSQTSNALPSGTAVSLVTLPDNTLFKSGRVLLQTQGSNGWIVAANGGFTAVHQILYPYNTDVSAFFQVPPRSATYLPPDTVAHDRTSASYAPRVYATGPLSMDPASLYFLTVHARGYLPNHSDEAYLAMCYYNDETCVINALSIVYFVYDSDRWGTANAFVIGGGILPQGMSFAVVNFNEMPMEISYSLIAANGPAFNPTAPNPNVQYMGALSPSTPLSFDGVIPIQQSVQLFTFDWAGSQVDEVVQLTWYEGPAVSGIYAKFFVNSSDIFNLDLGRPCQFVDFGTQPAQITVMVYIDETQQYQMYLKAFSIQAAIVKVPSTILTNGVPFTGGWSDGYSASIDPTGTTLPSYASNAGTTCTPAQGGVHFAIDVPAFATSLKVTVAYGGGNGYYFMVSTLPNVASTNSNLVKTYNGRIQHSTLAPIQLFCVQPGRYYVTVYNTAAVTHTPGLTVTATYVVPTYTPLTPGVAVAGRTKTTGGSSNAWDQYTIYTFTVPAAVTYSVSVYSPTITLFVGDNGDSCAFSGTGLNSDVASPVASKSINALGVTYYVAVTSQNAEEQSYVISLDVDDSSVVPLALNTPTAVSVWHGTQQMIFEVDSGATADPNSVVSVNIDSAFDFTYTTAPRNGAGVGPSMLVFSCSDRYVWITVKPANTISCCFNITFTITATLVTPTALTDGYSATLTLPNNGLALFSVPINQASVFSLVPAATSSVLLSTATIYGACTSLEFADPQYCAPDSPCVQSRTNAAYNYEAGATVLVGVLPGVFGTVPPTQTTNYQFTATAALGTSVAAAVVSEFCGDVGVAVSYGSNATQRDEAAASTFDNLYRSIACQIRQYDTTFPLCMPLSAACNASLKAYACESNYREPDGGGFVLSPCASFCADVITNCLPLTFQGLKRLGAPAKGYDATFYVPFDSSYCEDVSVTTCSGYVAPAPPPPPPPAEAIPNPDLTTINVGLVVGVVIGIFAVLAIVGVVLFIIMKNRKAQEERTKSVPMQTVRPASTREAPAPPTSAPSTPAPDSDFAPA